MTNKASELLALSTPDDSAAGLLSVAELGVALASDLSRTGDVLLYGFRDRPDHCALLADVTGVASARVSPVTVPSSELTWMAKTTALAPALSGMNLTLQVSASTFSSFDLQSEPNSAAVETLALLDGRPWFLRVRVQHRWVYLLGIDQIPDPETSVSSADQELPLVSAAIALMLFVRTHFPSLAWLPGQSFGNFVIDDPLLRPSYGFVRHEQLACHLTETGGAATIAFIPWNARRSERQTAELYKRSKNLSICVHGFEHISDEFVTKDIEDLRWRAESALDGMRLHWTLTGVEFEPVMVFPQGRFASRAIDALAGTGFLAAANSTFLASDAGGIVRLKHLLEPAVTAYGPLPLFRRRAPRYLSRFHYDLILGKPVLLVEHHEFFRDRGEAFRQVFEDVRKISERIEWAPLGEIARRVHMVREPRAGHTEVRFYCRQFRFRARRNGTYEFTKRESAADVRAVRVNGRLVDFVFEQDVLRFSVNCEASDSDLEVVVEARPEASSSKPRQRRESKLSVAARRYLSEGRDNYLATSSRIRSFLRF